MVEEHRDIDSERQRDNLLSDTYWSVMSIRTSATRPSNATNVPKGLSLRSDYGYTRRRVTIQRYVSLSLSHLVFCPSAPMCLCSLPCILHKSLTNFRHLVRILSRLSVHASCFLFRLFLLLLPCFVSAAVERLRLDPVTM